MVNDVLKKSLTLFLFLLTGKEFLGQAIKVEFAEKRVPKGGFGRGGGRGTF